VPKIIPPSQPASSAYRSNQRVNRPDTRAGKVCRIQMPPRSCRLIENVLGSSMANSSAPSLMTSETHCETLVCSLGLASGLKNSRNMFRVNRLAAAMDMIAAGTRAPMMMAAKAIPVNQLGYMCWNRNGTESCALPPAFLTFATVVLSASAM
jgi:hypothetical protein